MSEATFSFASSLWRLASAIAIIALGTLSLSGGRARPRGAFAFGLFAVAWGLQIGVGNAIMLVPPRLAPSAFMVFAACSLPATFFLVEFVVAQLATTGRARGILVVRGINAGLAFAGAFLLFLEPQGFIASSGITASGAAYIVRGPLFFWLLGAPQFIAFGLALYVLGLAWREAPTPRTSLRAATLVAGIGLYLAPTSGTFLVRYGVDVLVDVDSDRLGFAILFALLTLVIGRVIITAWRAAQRSQTLVEARVGRATAILLASGLVWGMIEGALASGPFPLFSTQGLWRLAGIAVISYGLLRWRLADLPQRAIRAAATGAGASAAAAGGMAAYGVVTLVAATPTLPVFAGLLTLSLSVLPGLRLARRLFSPSGRSAWVRDEDALYGQRVDAYRAAVEASLARGTLEEDEDFLAALRERFGITDSEDRLLRHYASACILAPRQGDSTAAYDRLRLLGEGGAGRTWLARDRVRDRLVVLKEPLERWQREPGLRETVLREARLASRVRHPNVIRVEEVIEHRGAPIIVMEFAEGGSLSDLLRRRGVLPWHEALDLALPVLRGVESIHQAGIIHRDLKPSNVLLTFDGEPKIADFGIATAARASHASASNARTVVDGTTFVGTLAYLAPEVRAGAPGDKRADVYACAAMLHEMLYGSPPGLEQPVLAKNDVPDALSRTLARALSSDPAQRPASARALAEELTTFRARAPRQ